MFASRYFNPRYWAARYWAKAGGTAVIGCLDGQVVISQLLDVAAVTIAPTIHGNVTVEPSE